MKWKEPITVRELLENCFDDSVRPQSSKGVYLISGKFWIGEPTSKCVPLYIGSNTVNMNRFRARIGDLIADMFGFFGEASSKVKAGHHSGGQSLYWYLREDTRKKNPMSLSDYLTHLSFE
jgi:hypothetical protein